MAKLKNQKKEGKIFIQGGDEMEKKWIEYLSKAVDAFIDDMKAVVPEETKTHLKNSVKEFMLAIRTLIDRKIEKFEEKKEEGHKVEVKEG